MIWWYVRKSRNTTQSVCILLVCAIFESWLSKYFWGGTVLIIQLSLLDEDFFFSLKISIKNGNASCPHLFLWKITVLCSMVGSFWKVASACGTAAPGHRDWLAEPWCPELPRAQSYQELASVHLQGQKTKLNVVLVGKAVPLQHHSPGQLICYFSALFSLAGIWRHSLCRRQTRQNRALLRSCVPSMVAFLSLSVETATYYLKSIIISTCKVLWGFEFCL